MRWLSYLGGPDSAMIRAVAATASGVYVGFSTTQADVWFVSPTALTPTRQGMDSLIAHVALDGSAVLNATYVGGSADEGGNPTVVADASGVYFISGTSSTDMVVTPGAAQPTYGGGVRDDFVTKFTPTLNARVYATYLGGSGAESMETHHLGLRADGALVAAVYTTSPNWPVSAGAFRTTPCGGASDIGVVVIAPDGTAFEAGTYVCGSGTDTPEGLDVLADGRVVVGGSTDSADWPVTAGGPIGSRDAVASVLSADVSSLLVSLRFGTPSTDYGRSLAATANGFVLVGQSAGAGLAVTTGAAQPTYAGGAFDGFWLRVVVTPPSQEVCVVSPFVVAPSDVQVSVRGTGVAWFGTMTVVDDRGCAAGVTQ
jgi:hypothetical protein